MRIDVVRPEAWEELNDRVRGVLQLNPPLRARSYLGLSQAVFEICQSTAHFMSHKRAIAYIQGQSPLFENLLSYYYKETYEVQLKKHAELMQMREWVESLRKDTNFVVFSEDHPVTGETYPFADELDALLNEKRIYSFRISHFQHLYKNIEIRPYTVRFCSYTESAAVAVLGERFRSPPMAVQSMPWDQKTFIEQLQKSFDTRYENRALVEKIEQELSSTAQLYFSKDSSRLYDRAVCVFPDVSADSLATHLFKKWKLPPEEGFAKMTTTNMCHWAGMKTFGSWWQPAPSAELLRGLLVVGAEFLNTKDFAKELISSYEDIKTQQSWDV